MVKSILSANAVLALSQPTANATVGVCFRFDTGPEYYLRSTDKRVDPNGIVWQAGSHIANIDGLQIGVGRRTQNVTITANGLPGSKWVKLATESTSIVRGRRIEFYLHLFDKRWKYVEPPTSLGVYEMDRLTVSFDGQDQKGSVSLICEPIGVSKFRAPNAYLDRRDQRARHPGDTACDMMPRYVNQQVLLPW